MTSNLIPNGDFFDWPLGTSFTTAGGSGTTPVAGDLSWVASGASQPVVTLSQQEHPVTSSVKQGFPRYFFRLSPSTAPALGTSDKAYLSYKIIETIDRSIQGQYGTFTFWARGTATEIVVQASRSFGTGGHTATGATQYVYALRSFQISKDWMKYQLDIPFIALPGATYGAGSAVEIRIYMQGGATELGTQQIAWRTGNFDFSQVSLTLRTVEEFNSSRLPGGSPNALAVRVNVADYLPPGESADGTFDNTATVAAAYAKLSSVNGGELFFPLGKWKFNLVITKSNATVSGVSHMRNTSTTPTFASFFQAADITKPVIQIGDDTGYVRGVSIRDVSLDGQNGGQLGVYFAGGAFECSMENAAVVYFTTGIKVQGGASYPASLIYFNRVHGHPNISADNGRGILIANAANYPISYTTEIDFSDCHWQGPSSGLNSYVMEIDSCEVKVSNCYFDISGGHGIKFSHNVTTPLPKLNAINSNLDSGLSTNVAIEGYTNDRNFTGLASFNFQVNGSWKELDGTLIAPLAQPITTILKRSTATRGTLLMLNTDGATSSCQIQFRDQINNKNPDIFAQSTSINIRAENGGAVKFGNISGGNWAQVNGTDGATFFFGAGITANTIPLFDANRQLKSSPSTGTGSVVLSTNPTITNPILVGGSSAPVQINSPAAQTISALTFFDTVNNNTVDIRGQNGALLLRGLSGGAVKLTDSAGTSMFQVNGADGAAFFFGAGVTANTLLYLDGTGRLSSILPTITTPGTTGAQTINKPSGRVNFAAGAQTLVITNSFVASGSAILATIKSDDATAKSVIVSAQSLASFTLKLNTVATAEIAVDFLVVN